MRSRGESVQTAPRCQDRTRVSGAIRQQLYRRTTVPPCVVKGNLRLLIFQCTSCLRPSKGRDHCLGGAVKLCAGCTFKGRD